ncbi:MAG TPA: hypothetical protein VFL41_06705 [Gaiellaceae bacterium]|nr:hypothetical protein [Gaiellaceae bacterium]
MSTNRRRERALSPKLAVVFLFALLAVLVSAAAGNAAPTAVPTPYIRGTAPLPGPVAPAARPAATMGIITATRDTGPSGTPTTLTAKRLAPNADVSLVWMTSSVAWVLDPRADSVDYIGRSVSKFGVVLARLKTDAGGSFTYRTKFPQDFGGLHDIYAVVDGVQVARGGVLITRRYQIWPKRGPVGTKINIKVSGLGSSLYESGLGVYYDNKFSGIATANWTRGVATVSIRAAGPVGRHTLVMSSAMQANYLNPAQSPIPWANLHNTTFTVTRDAGLPKTAVEWPLNVRPTISPTTTLAAENLLATSGKASLSQSRGFVTGKATLTASGLTPGTPVSIVWATVVGNRVNCVGICWVFSQVPMTTLQPNADGSLRSEITIPDGLGGWHFVQLLQNGRVMTQAPYFVQRNLISVSDRSVRRGQEITIRLKGIGWTQLDNTVAVVYDNGYIGYGCGFNSAGDVQIKVTATGVRGTHLIDLYPLLYTQNPVYATATYGMVPFLSFRRDAPGLAVGYRLPAIRLAIKIVN